MMKPKGRHFRRRQDDREAGLALEWRLPRGSFGRMVLGVLSATLLFAGAASVLHVRVPFASVPSSEAAQVVALGENDASSRELRDWARFHSPFPDRWEPRGTGLLDHRIGQIEAELAASCAYRPRLLPRVEGEPVLTRPGFVEMEQFPLPPPSKKPSGPIPTATPARVDAVAGARGPLRERWEGARLVWGGPDDALLVGQAASFTVGVAADGQVTFCLPAAGLGDQVDDRIRAWLLKMTLPAGGPEEGVTIDVVDVRFVVGGAEDAE